MNTFIIIVLIVAAILAFAVLLTIALMLLKAQLKLIESRFSELAAAQLAARQRDIVGLSQQSVDGVVRGLKERLLQYEQKVEAMRDETRNNALTMFDHVKSFERFATVAQNYTSALIGGNKIQGNQGEAILANILEQSGLQSGIEYDTQVGTREEGAHPDLCIYDALNKRSIFVDAKMNIKDFIEAYNLPDDTVENKKAKKSALQKHVTSIRKQIADLSERHYPETVASPREGYSNLPIVAMFCPFNAILEAAILEDPTLMQFAFEHNVVLVTPVTLWGYLWLISYGWKKVEAEKKIEEIQSLGGDVIEKVDALLQDIENVGDALAKANTACDNLRKRAGDKGQMSVKRAAQALLDYGSVASKTLKQVGKPDFTG